jgi:N-acetylglucosaminyl-diphospho-decaprenol L-rhamnosyltransferase
VGVTLVVVHYLTREPLSRLLDSIRVARPGPLREILLVNNSGETIEDLLLDLPCPARVLTPGHNLGYARGVNEGVRAAGEEDVLILNPDVIVVPDSIEALVRCAADRPRAGIVAPQLLHPDGRLQDSARRFYNWKSLLLRRIPLGPWAARTRVVREHLMADWDHADTRPVDWVIGAAMYVRRRAIRDVGLMDERYFLYFEDVDWCQRMWRHGYEVVYCADARMGHDYARASAGLRPRSVRAHAAGLLRFAEKWSAFLYAMTQYRRRLAQILTLLLDAMAAGFAFLMAFGIRAALDGWFSKPVYPLASYQGLLFFTVVVTVAALAAAGLYRRLTFVDSVDRAVTLAKVAVQAEVFLMAATFLFQMPRYSRFLVLLLLPFLYVGLYVSRALGSGFAAGARRRGFAFRRVLVIGTGDDAERTRAALEGARRDGFEPLAAVVPADAEETPGEAARRIRSLLEAERVQILCLAPSAGELPYLLALGYALRDSGIAIYWTGALARLGSESAMRRLGPLDVVLLHTPSRGLSLRVRKRASDLLLSLLIAPFRWSRLRGYLAARGGDLGAGEAWRMVWSGERSWVGRSAYERDLWAGVPDWARLALESVRPGVVTPANGPALDHLSRVNAELAYLARFSLAEDLRIFLRATRGGAS